MTPEIYVGLPPSGKRMFRHMDYDPEASKAFREVEKITGVTRHQIQSMSRKTPIPNAKVLMTYIMRKINQRTQEEVAKVVGLKEHSTIWYHEQVIEKAQDGFDPELKQMIEQVKEIYSR